MSTSIYPVHVDAQLDPEVSRGLWLVKWLLVLPHYVVLAFLWAGFLVLSVVAFFAILLSGRYPRAIFEFNVGVLRWSWRVAYYAYGALATDRYPPFSLGACPDYPAHLEIEYPGRLSRGLVLVKWWLLAIPHYLIVAFFVGGGLYFTYRVDGYDGSPWVWSAGLIGLLALLSAVALLFTGRYPQQLFDLILGLNRWVLRVAGYAALMTDTYPPFRLDQGGPDPDRATLAVDTPPAPPAAANPEAPPSSGGPVWSVARVVALAVGSVIVLGSIGVGVGGGALAFVNSTMRDRDGFVMSDTHTLSSDAYAITSDRIELDLSGVPDGAVPRSVLGDAKVTAAAPDGSAVFVGIAPSADAAAYLRGVPHHVVTSLRHEPDHRLSGGTATPAAPTQTDIWVAQSSGTGTQTVVWPVESGDWTLVLMRPDAAAGVSVDTAIGVTAPNLDWVIGIVFTIAGIGLIIGIALVAGALGSAHRAAERTASAEPR